MFCIVRAYHWRYSHPTKISRYPRTVQRTSSSKQNAVCYLARKCRMQRGKSLKNQQFFKKLFISIDSRMAWVPCFSKILDARSQRRIWRFLHFPRNQSDHYWQRQDRNDSRTSGYSMGWPRSFGLRLEKTWLRCTYSWAHPRVRRTAVWRKILYQSRQCHRLLLSIEQ